MAAAPLPSNTEDALRWEFSRLVYRILAGEWENDLHARVTRIIGAKRKRAWGGVVDLNANLLATAVYALAKLYDRPPIVSHAQGDAVREHLERIEATGLWALMQTFQAEVLALREAFIRVEVEPDLAGQPQLSFRVVYPHEVTVRCLASRPDRPVEIREVRRRLIGGRWQWTWDVLSLVDAAGASAPSYKVVLEDGTDVTKAALGKEPGELSGDAYPYRDSRGVPVLPYALYRAQRSGSMWNVHRSRSLVEGTLHTAVKFTFLQHCEMHAAWIQRWGIDVVHPEAEWMDELAGDENGADDGDGAGRSAVVTDPTKVELFRSTDNAVSPQLGAFPSPTSPAEMLDGVTRYERRCISMAGIVDADQVRVDGDPRSGYSLSVKRDGQREAQRRYEPTFREGDLELVRLAAILWNRATQSSIPEDGYAITYQGIPLSPEEQKAQREHLLALMAAGLIDRISAYQAMHPGMTAAQAAEELDRIAASNAPLQPQATQPEAPATQPEAPEPEEAEVEDEAPEPEDGGGEGLNGAQIREAVAIADKVAFGEMERMVAEILLIELGMDPDRAKRMVDGIQARTRPVEPGQAPAPAAEPEPA